MSLYTDLDTLGSGGSNITFGCDLSGTDTCQTVIGLYGNALSNSTPTDGQVLQWNNTAQQWQPTTVGITFTAGGDLSGTASSQTVIGIQNRAVYNGAPSDTQILMWIASNNRWEPTTLTFSGDISGTYPSPSVDKIHGTSVPASPSANQVLVATSGTTAIWSKIVDGYVDATAAIAYSKLNLSNSIVNADVNSSAAIAVSKLAAGTAAQVLLNNSTPTPTWTSISGDISLTSAGAVTVSKIQGNAVKAETEGASQDGYVLTWVNGNSQWEAKPTAPTVTFAGDLSGTVSSQTVEKIKGTTITTAGGSLATGAVLRVTGAASADWGAVDLADTDAVTGVLPTSNQAAQSLGGDLSGTTTSASVNKIRGNSVKNETEGAAQDGYVLTWVNSNSQWEALPAAVSFTAGGDLTGTNTSQTVAKLQGSTLSSPVSSGSANKVLHGDNSGTLNWSLVDLANDVTGTLPTGNQAAQSLAGDASGTTAAVSVDKIKATSITTSGGALATGAVLRVTGASSADWGAVDLADTDAVTGVLPTGNQAAQTMAGDVTGTTAASVVAKINGATVPAAGSLTTGHVLQVSGASATTYGYVVNANVDSAAAIAYSKLNLASSIVNADVSSSAAIDVNKLAAGTSAQILMNNGTPTPTWTSISGDITTTNAGVVTVGKVQNRIVHDTTPNDGDLLTWDNSNSYWKYAAASGGPPSGSAGGDLQGTYPNPTIKQLTGLTNKVSILCNSLQFDSAVSGGNLNFASTSSGAGSALTITAQNTTAASQTGGTLSLFSGSAPLATGTAGDIIIAANSALTPGTTYIKYYDNASAAQTLATFAYNATTIAKDTTINGSLTANSGTITGTFTAQSTSNIGSTSTKNTLKGGIIRDGVVAITANVTCGDGYWLVSCGTRSGDITVTLPASPTTGREIIVKDTSGTSGTTSSRRITVAGNGNNIDGSSTFIINQDYAAFTFVYTGSQWSVV